MMDRPISYAIVAAFLRTVICRFLNYFLLFWGSYISNKDKYTFSNIFDMIRPNILIMFSKLYFLLMYYRSSLKASITLLPLLGLCWIFGFLQFNHDTLVFSYTFVILNASQVTFSKPRFLDTCLEQTFAPLFGV